MRKVDQLTDDAINAALAANVRAFLADGGGLYFAVTPKKDSPVPAASWVFRYRAATGKLRDKGLGAFPLVTLAAARKEARNLAGMRARGLDPLDEEKRERAEDLKAKPVTFREQLDVAHAAHTATFKRQDDKDTFRNSVIEHASGLLNQLVSEAEPADVAKAIAEVWDSNYPTAKQVLGRVRIVFDSARAAGYRTKSNPAEIGLMKALLPGKKHKTEHRAAVPVKDAPAIYAAIRAEGDSVALALEFAALTGARAGEVCQADHSQIDHAEQVWNVPAEVMKTGIPHTVPLCGRALEILKEAGTSEGRIFKAASGGDLYDKALLRKLQKFGDFTTHGWRSTFRDWAGDATETEWQVAEAALSHAVGNATERAYRRGTALAKRRKLMDQWEAFLTMVVTATTTIPAGNVVPFAKSA